MSRYILTFAFLLQLSTGSLCAICDQLPNPIVGGYVNAITGDAVIGQVDHIIPAAQPLTIQRFYVSGDAASDQRDWEFFPHSRLTLYLYSKNKVTEAKVYEPNGTALRYTSLTNTTLSIKDDGIGVTNTSQGEISAQTNYRNYRLDLRRNEQGYFIATVTTANGTVRTYRAVRKKPDSTFSSIYCYLVKERLPNGNVIIYTYDPNLRLQGVHTKNPSENKTYSSAHFIYNDNILKIETSDHKTLFYSYLSSKDKRAPRYLTKVRGDLNSIDFTYAKPKKHTQPKVQQINLSNLDGPFFSYYLVKNNRLPNQTIKISKPTDPRCERVRELFLPVGPNGDKQPAYKFIYEVGTFIDQYFGYSKNGYTKAYDCGNGRTEYHFNKRLKLTDIIKFFAKSPTSLEHHRYIWRDSYLKEIHLLDEDQKIIAKREFSYDRDGNIIKNQLTGQINTNQEQTFSTYAEYTSDKYHLLFKQYDDTGHLIRFSYLPFTNLPTARYEGSHNEILQREFFVYNDDNILIKTISDDGSELDSNNLKGVTQRFITLITPNSNNLPESITEYYLDIKSKTKKLHKTTTISYGKNNLPITTTHFDANNKELYTLETSYDNKNRLISETNPINQKTTYHYDKHNRLVQTNFLSNQSITTYDKGSRPYLTQLNTYDYLAKTQETQYDCRNRPTVTIDEYGNKTQTLYDTLDRPTKIILPQVLDHQKNLKTPIQTFKYDRLGNLICHVDPKNHHTHSTYNIYNQPLKIEYPDGRVETFTYNTDGLLNSYTDPQGLKTCYVYDVLKRLLVKNTFDSKNKLLTKECYTYNGFNLLSYTNPKGVLTHYNYDDAGRKISEQTLDRSIFYLYDNQNRLASTTYGDTTHITEYDLLDRPIAEIIEDHQGSILRQKKYQYDKFGNLSDHIEFTDVGLSTTHYQYDGFNRLIKQTDPLGHITTVNYDKVIHKTTTTDPLGLQTIEEYDPLNRLSDLKKVSSEKTLLAQENYYYDLNNNLSWQESTIINPDNTLQKHHTLWNYGPCNQLLSLTQAAHTKDNLLTRYFYTNGLLTKIQKPNKVDLIYNYDIFSRLSSLESSDDTVHYTYSYDKLGQIISSTDCRTNTSTNRAYNAYGEVSKETLANDLTLRYTYDIQGRRTKLTLPDKSAIQYAYNGPNLKAVQRSSSSGEVLYTHNYLKYDLAGQILLAQGIENLGLITYKRDLAKRLFLLKDAYNEHHIQKRDPLGNILKANSQNIPLSYSYDSLYQIRSENNHTYSFDSHSVRLAKDNHSLKTNPLHQVISDSESTYGYDANGNRITIQTPSSTTHYVYDALDRLIKVKTADATIQYQYDSFNRCISRNQQLFFYDNQKEIGSYSNNEMSELRILGIGNGAEIGATIAIEIDSKFYAPLHDHQGNIIALIKPKSRKLIEAYTFTTFGEEETTPSQPRNPWRYGSKRTDPDTNLINFGQRFYDPHLGSWINPDPSGFIDGLNLYLFANNNPLSFLDLYGLAISERKTDKDYSYVSEKSFSQQNSYPLFNDAVSYRNISSPCSSCVFTRFPDIELQGISFHKSEPTKSKIVELEEYIGKESLPFIQINGLCTSLSEVTKRAYNFADKAGGKQITSVYVANIGFLKEFTRAFLERERLYFTEETRITKKAIINKLKEYPNEDIYIQAFSRGSAVLWNTLPHLTEKQKCRLTIHTFGAAKFIYDVQLKEVKNFYSIFDGVALLNFTDHIIKGQISCFNYRPERTIIKLHKKAKFLLDHSYNGNYHENIQRTFENYNKK